METTIEILREKLHQFIDQVEVKKLQAMYVIFEDEIADEIIDVEEYNKDIEAAEEEIKQGKSHTHEEVLEMIKAWKKEVA